MELTVLVFVALSGLELLLWLPLVWRARKPLACILLLAIAVVSGALVAADLQAWTIILTIFSLYRMVNLLRLIEGRIQADYLYHATRRTSFCLIGLQVADAALVGAGNYYHIGILAYLYVLVAVQLAAGLVLLASTLKNLKTTSPPVLSEGIADRDLPSLSVALPARNETTDLEACLQSLAGSSYPKLEILVLDDCSQNKRTAEIIRDFAQEGVRFIAGKTPPEQWLAKNYAYDQLAKEASGEILLFCGVDVRFEKDSLETIVKTLLQKKKKMISIVPRNIPPPGWGINGMLVQPSRYTWELALPWRLLRRPAALSTCWIITSQALQAAGGFKAVSRKAVPESYLARQAALAGDGYSLLQSDASIGISSLKSLAEQQATAIRTRYPQLHRRPELVALVGLGEFTALIGPLVLLIAAVASQTWLLGALASLAYLMEAVTYSKIVNLTYRKVLLRGMWLLPVAAFYDVAILNCSMWQYEFRTVTWKGRNVCIPVMRVTDNLPKLY